MRCSPSITLFFVLCCLGFKTPAEVRALPAGLPSPPARVAPSDPRIPALQAKIQRARVFGAYRDLIEIYKRAGWYDEAARLHLEQAPLYEKRGFTDAALIQRNEARNLQSELQVFSDVQLPAQALGRLSTGAPAEPIHGCYLGAFIDRDDSLGPTFFDENYQSHRSPEQFFGATGRLPGSLFMYIAYGQPFPRAWLERLKHAGCIPHLAWEPASLGQVKDDEYLNSFAKGLRALDWPVFIRFASEMNGRWTPYYGNPALYRQKFRLVNQVLHRHAPRVATVWCVNNPPWNNAYAYYPGDDGCDWVGVNFYSVAYHENDRSQPGFEENPLALLDPIYNRYASKKPIAICEFAASHQSTVEARPHDQFAIDKMKLVYGALPLLYPRVKLIDWFDMNTIKYPSPGKTRSNYVLTEKPRILRSWREATDHPFYLSQYQHLGDKLPPVARPLNRLTVPNGATIRLWARTFDPRARVFVALDDKMVASSEASGAIAFKLNATPGSHVMTAYLYDSKRRFQRQTSAAFTVR